MRKLMFLLILIRVLNTAQAIQNDELLELSCRNETNCKQFQDPNTKSACIEGQCKCINTKGETVKCQPLNRELSNTIGGMCPCNQPNAECDLQENVCYCMKDYVPSIDKRRCIKKMAALDEECEQDSQCQEIDFNAICHESKECQCMRHFVNNGGKCASIVGSKSPSLNDSTCREQYGENTKYSKTDEQCLCMPGYFASVDNSHCMKISKYLEPCTEHLQCIGAMGPGGQCLENVCQCSEKYFVEKTEGGEMTHRCSAIVQRGHYCRYDQDCYQHHLNETDESMQCVHGECSCKNGYYSYNDGACGKGSGASFKPLIGLQSLLALSICAKKYLYSF